MGSKSKGGDRLSRYFQDLNESDIDSDSEGSDDESSSKSKSKEPADTDTAAKKNEGEGDEETEDAPTTAHLQDSSTPKGTSVEKLPSARDCFGNKSNPTFLNLHQKREINWDQSTHLKVLAEDENQIIDYKSNAVPPPTSYEPVTDSGIKVVDSEGRKRKSAAEELEERRISSKTCRQEGGGAHSTEASTDS